ncbi:MAG: hypothetical protein U1F61_30550 [Opitutaceae bacterium]
MNSPRPTFTESLLFGLLLAVLIPLEWHCARLAFETMGEVASGLYYLALGLNLVPILLSRRSVKWAGVGAFGLGLLVVPYQLQLGQRQARIQEEVTRIASYAHLVREKTGSYPSDLTRYSFHDLSVRPYLQAYRLRPKEGDFMVTFFVSTPNTSHWYSPVGGWGYYPD